MIARKQVVYVVNNGHINSFYKVIFMDNHELNYYSEAILTWYLCSHMVHLEAISIHKQWLSTSKTFFEQNQNLSCNIFNWHPHK